MRYRKRISLGGGTKLNLSKSGVSLSTGIKGLSVTTGKKGTYLNAGIPGTGIYDRVKISGSSTSKAKDRYQVDGDITEDASTTKVALKLVYNDDGSINVLDNDGNEITDPYLLRKVKAAPEYRNEIARMTKERLDEYAEQMDKIINIQRITPNVYSTEDSMQRINNMKPRRYEKRPFPESEPSMEDVIADLYEEASQTIDSWSKRRKAKLCDKYVKDNKVNVYKARYQAYLDRKNSYFEQEEANKARFSEEERIRLAEEKERLMRMVNGDEGAVDEAIASWLSDVRLPFDFNVDYEHTYNGLCIDLDLPEIEDMPDTKVQKMANGTAKYKPKSKKEVKADYSNCVFGLAVFFAGCFFDKALSIQNIILSGYTQRRNRAGDIVDDYIYSFLFDRDTFTVLDYNDDPRDNCLKFPNRVIQNADMGFKTIVPYSAEEMMDR